MPPTEGDKDEVIAALRARVHDLESSLAQKDMNLAIAFRLTAANANLLGLLLTLTHVTPELITQKMEVATDPRVAMFRLREALQPFGIVIESRRGIGYWLEPSTKRAIRELIAARADA